MAKDAVYIFPECSVTDPTQIASVRRGILQRTWGMRVNGPFNPQQLLNDGAQVTAISTTKIIRGSDGKLFDLATGAFLANVPEWEAVITPNTEDYLPAGEEQERAVRISFRIDLNFTETHMTDALIKRLFDSLASGAAEAFFDFKGQIRSRG